MEGLRDLMSKDIKCIPPKKSLHRFLKERENGNVNSTTEVYEFTNVIKQISIDVQYNMSDTPGTMLRSLLAGLYMLDRELNHGPDAWHFDDIAIWVNASSVDSGSEHGYWSSDSETNRESDWTTDEDSDWTTDEKSD